MAMKPTDARLRELQFLAKLDRANSFDIKPPIEDPREKQMIAHLLDRGFLNSIGTQNWSYRTRGFDNYADVIPANNPLFQEAEWDRWNSMNKLLGDQRLTLYISHAGRVRLSELQQELQTGRDREPFQILLGQRHILPDLAIALAATTSSSPVSVAYLDANGFKAINDTINHAAGDEALRTFMSVVASITEGRGEAYRAGGDELVVIMPSTATDIALTTMRAVANQLHKEKMPGGLPLSVSCGIGTTTDANADAAELLKKADEEQKRAKARSRVDAPRPSVIAVEGKELVLIPLALE